MTIVMGLDQHRAQITAEWLDTDNDEISRKRIRPADRHGVRAFAAVGLAPRPGTGSSASSTASPSAKPCQDQPRTPGSALWSWPVPADGMTMLGLPTLKVAYQLTGSDATVVARLWDVAKDGVRRFVTRGVYRLSSSSSVDTSARALEFQLFGNHWHFEPGHRIELALTQSEAPYLRPDNLPSTVTYTAPSLSLPVGDR